MKKQRFTILVAIILAVILSALAFRYYIYEIPHGRIDAVVGEGCDFSKEHLIYDTKTKKQICVSGEAQ